MTKVTIYSKNILRNLNKPRAVISFKYRKVMPAKRPITSVFTYTHMHHDRSEKKIA